MWIDRHPYLFIYLLGSVLAVILMMLRVILFSLLGWLTKSNVLVKNLRKLERPDGLSQGLKVLILLGGLALEAATSWISVIFLVWHTAAVLLKEAREALTFTPEAIRLLRFPLRNNPNMSREAVWAHVQALNIRACGTRPSGSDIVDSLDSIRLDHPSFSRRAALHCLEGLNVVSASTISSALKSISTVDEAPEEAPEDETYAEDQPLPMSQQPTPEDVNGSSEPPMTPSVPIKLPARATLTTQPTDEEKRALEKRFPMPERSDHQTEEGYQEAVAGVHRARRRAAPFGQFRSKDSPINDTPLGTPVKLIMVPGKEALKPENIIKIFEALKGRAATEEERAIAYRPMRQPSEEKECRLEKRFPMPDRANYEDQESYEEAVARTQLNAVEAELRRSDPQYEKNKALLVPLLQPIIAELPPNQWEWLFRQAYMRIENAKLVPVNLMLMQGSEAQKASNVMRVVEQIMGRPMTEQERADLIAHRKAKGKAD